MSMTDEQDAAYEAAVRHDADTIDSEAAHDKRYLINKLDSARMQIRDLQSRMERLSCRYEVVEMRDCLHAIINLDEKGLSPSNELIERAKAAIGYCVAAAHENAKAQARRANDQNV